MLQRIKHKCPVDEFYQLLTVKTTCAVESPCTCNLPKAAALAYFITFSDSIL